VDTPRRKRMNDFVDRMKDAVNHLKKAEEIFQMGPLDYYLRKLVEHSEALMGYSPIKKGQRAVIVKKIACKGGWAGSEMNLAVGVEGEVIEVDYRDGSFVYDFVPDVQMYQTHDGEYKEQTSKSSYCLRAKYLHPLEE